MIEARKRETNIGVGLGFGLMIGGRALMLQGSDGGIALVLAGTAVFVWGCMSYALGKGYARWWGLLGLASVLGLIVLVLMRDKRASGAWSDGWPEDRSHDARWAPPRAT